MKNIFRSALYAALVLIAGFAVMGVWNGVKNPSPADPNRHQAAEPSGEESTDQVDPDSKEPNPPSEVPDEPIPDGAIAVVNRDLSCPTLGASYLHNETAYDPNVSLLLQTDVSSPVTSEPLVLILHTHTSESYLKKGQTYLTGDLGEATYSSDEEENMLAVGQELCKVLNQKGITALHCTVMHDDPTLSGSYARALRSIEFYLTHYPSIRYVIDLHRDSVLTSDGEYIRATASDSEESVAQMMAVVGSDGGGETNERWEGNLALALQLREELNHAIPSVCRPVTLRNETYNQELAPYSLLIEVGTGGNCIEEALAAARLLGEALSNLIYGQ